MKSMSVLLVICAILSGCGLNKRGYHSDLESGKTTENPFSFSLEGIEPEMLHSFSGSNYAILHTAPEKKFPAAVQQMDSESEIGTLDIERAQQIYQPEYDDEPIYNQISRKEKTTFKVYVLKTRPGTISLGIKWEKVKDLQPEETPVEVKFQRGPYCSRVQIYLNQLKDRISIPDQYAECAPSKLCNAKLRVEVAPMFGGGDKDIKFDLDRPMASWQCLETKSAHLKSTKKVNRNWVRKGTVRLNGLE